MQLKLCSKKNNCCCLLECICLILCAALARKDLDVSASSSMHFAVILHDFVLLLMLWQVSGWTELETCHSFVWWKVGDRMFGNFFAWLSHFDFLSALLFFAVHVMFQSFGLCCFMFLRTQWCELGSLIKDVFLGNVIDKWNLFCTCLVCRHVSSNCCNLPTDSVHLNKSSKFQCVLELSSWVILPSKLADC